MHAQHLNISKHGGIKANRCKSLNECMCTCMHAENCGRVCACVCGCMCAGVCVLLYVHVCVFDLAFVQASNQRDCCVLQVESHLKSNMGQVGKRPESLRETTNACATHAGNGQTTETITHLHSIHDAVAMGPILCNHTNTYTQAHTQTHTDTHTQ